MDFIERAFGVAPDGGNGLLEVSLIAVLAGLAVMLLILRRERRRAKPPGVRRESA